MARGQSKAKSGLKTVKKPETGKGLDSCWIRTYTGKKFYYLAPYDDVESIDIEDIAMALSRAPRWCGHTGPFYSVAQHSALVAMELKKRGLDLTTQMIGLLHDATEAYMGDLPSPLKRICPEYSEIEKAVWDRISYKFLNGEVLPIPPVVKECDRVLLSTEAEDCFDENPLLDNEGWVSNRAPRREEIISPWDSTVAKLAFLNYHWVLEEQIQKEMSGQAEIKAMV